MPKAYLNLRVHGATYKDMSHFGKVWITEIPCAWPVQVCIQTFLNQGILWTSLLQKVWCFSKQRRHVSSALVIGLRFAMEYRRFLAMDPLFWFQFVGYKSVCWLILLFFVIPTNWCFHTSQEVLLRFFAFPRYVCTFRVTSTWIFFPSWIQLCSVIGKLKWKSAWDTTIVILASGANVSVP